MNRKVLRPVTLSTGLHLPAGTSIAFPSDAVNRDPELYERPSDFDGFRFARLHTKPGSENSFQFTSSNASGFSFGKSDMTSLSTTCISPPNKFVAEVHHQVTAKRHVPAAGSLQPS